jgi:hypothetical protein
LTDATWCAVEHTPQMRGTITGICSAGTPFTINVKPRFSMA